MENTWQLWGEGKLEGRGTEQKGKRIRDHGQQHEDCWGQGSLRGLKDKGKIYNKGSKNGQSN